MADAPNSEALNVTIRNQDNETVDFKVKASTKVIKVCQCGTSFGPHQY